MDLKRKQPSNLLSSDEGMIPMINIIFLLLIFFMIAGQIDTQTAALELPQSISESEQSLAEITISLDQEGVLRLNGELLGGTLDSALATLSIDESTVVNCRAHRTLPASALDPVLKAVRKLKIQRLHIATESRG